MSKGQNSIILICSRMKELTFFKIYPITPRAKWLLWLAFYRENCSFDDKHCFFSKMAADCGIRLSCFLEVAVILEV